VLDDRTVVDADRKNIVLMEMELCKYLLLVVVDWIVVGARKIAIIKCATRNCSMSNLLWLELSLEKLDKAKG